MMLYHSQLFEEPYKTEGDFRYYRCQSCGFEYKRPKAELILVGLQQIFETETIEHMNYLHEKIKK